MNRNIKLLFLIPLLLTLSCNQQNIDSSSVESFGSSESYDIKYEEDFYVLSKDYYEKNKYHNYNDLDSIKLSLYHQETEQDTLVPYSFPDELINLIKEPLLPLTKIRIYYDENGSIVNYAVIKNANHYFVKAVAVPKNEEETSYDFDLNYYRYGRDDFAFDDNFQIIEKYDEFYYQSIADLNFKFSISDDEIINRLFNLSMVFDYVIKDENGNLIKANELSIGEVIYVLIYPGHYPCYIYSYNPFEISTTQMLDQGGEIYHPFVS